MAEASVKNQNPVEMTIDELVDSCIKDAQAMAELKKRLGNFDPFDAVKKASEIIEEFDERLGYVRYGELTTAENSEIKKIADDKDREIQLIYAMLHKGYPTLTIDDVQKMPAWQTGRLSLMFGKHITRFLPKVP
jgi:hypothetical protein